MPASWVCVVLRTSGRGALGLEGVVSSARVCEQSAHGGQGRIFGEVRCTPRIGICAECVAKVRARWSRGVVPLVLSRTLFLVVRCLGWRLVQVSLSGRTSPSNVPVCRARLEQRLDGVSSWRVVRRSWMCSSCSDECREWTLKSWLSSHIDLKVYLDLVRGLRRLGPTL